jgi:Leucine-rich repeat (LRR) protein
MEEEGISLSQNHIKEGLSLLGKHPLANAHAYLHLQATDQHITNIDEISSYPLLVYVDLSNNRIEELKPLEKLSCLAQLRLRYVHRISAA